MSLFKLIVVVFMQFFVLADSGKGWDIALKMKAANEGFIGETSVMKLTLIDPSGQSVEREMLGQSIELDKMDRSLMNFQKPADVKGTKLLTWAHENKNDDQWLYLPSLRRVKRINSRTRGSSFMGSEFSFEDLGGQSIDKYTFTFITDSSINGHKVWEVKRVSKEKSSYSKVILFVSKKYLSAIKVQYYNKRNELLKFSELTNFKEYTVNGKKIYRSNKISMNNVQTKKRSIFTWSGRKLGLKLKKSIFVKKSLR